MKKFSVVIIILSTLMSVIGCGKNYTGQYIGMFTEMQTICRNSRGEVFDPNRSIWATIPEGYHIYYVYSFIKNILSIKQDKSGITGNFVITDDKQLVEFVVKTGYIDKENKLHLKMIWKPDVNIGFSFMGMSASGSLGEMLLNFDEVDYDEKNKIKFKVTGSVNLLSGLFPADTAGEHAIVLEKYNEKEAEQYVDNFKKLILQADKDKIRKYIKEKNYYSAMIIKDLLEYLGEKMNDDLVKEINAIKEAYYKEMPGMVKKDITIAFKSVKTQSTFYGIVTNINFDIENKSDNMIKMANIEIICRDMRNKKVVGKGLYTIYKMGPNSIKSDNKLMDINIPDQYVKCEYKVIEVQLPDFER